MQWSSVAWWRTQVPALCHQLLIVMLLAMEGANYHQGHTYVRGHVEHVVRGVIVYLQVLMVIMKNVHAMPT